MFPACFRREASVLSSVFTRRMCSSSRLPHGESSRSPKSDTYQSFVFQDFLLKVYLVSAPSLRHGGAVGDTPQTSKFPQAFRGTASTALD